MTLFTIAILVLALTFIANAILFISTFNRRSQSNQLLTIFRLHIAAIASWALFILLLLLTAQAADFPIYEAFTPGYTLAQMVFLAATILFSTNYWFVELFVHNRVRITILSVIMILLQISTAIASVIPNVLYTTIEVVPEGYVQLAIEPLNALYGIFLLAHLIVPLFILYWYKRKETEVQKRKQFAILLPFYLFFLLLSMTFNWVLPVYFGIFNFNAYGPTTSVILVIGITYAIVKYQFLDIRTVIQRGLIYTLLFIFIMLVYSAALNFTAIFFDARFVLDDFFSGLFTTIIGIVTIPRLDTWLRQKTDSWFFKDTYNYQDALHELSESLYKNIELDKLVPKLETQLQDTLRTESVTLSQERPRTEEDHLIIPIIHNHDTVGYLQIGPKRSGDAFTKDDQQLLETFALQASTAIGRALLYQEVKEHAKELEQKVSDRTFELQTLQEKQRDMMLYISHDLQTPLTIFQTKLEKLKQIEGHTEIVESLETSLLDLSRFISQLLRYAKLETGREEFTLETGDASAFMHELLDEVQIIADEAGVIVERDITPGITLTYDQNKMREVIMNLASNAIKYRDDTKHERFVKFTTKETDKAHICSIEDNGIGIAAEDLPHIFEHFYRVKGADTVKGTGLGLAVVHELVAFAGGTITADSTVGTGTTFTMTFPKKNYQAAVEKVQAMQ